MRGVVVGVIIGACALLAVAATSGNSHGPVGTYGVLQLAPDAGTCLPGLTNQGATLLTSAEGNTVYYGLDTSVTALNGTPLAPGEKLSIPLAFQGQTTPATCLYSPGGTDGGGIRYVQVGP